MRKNQSFAVFLPLALAAAGLTAPASAAPSAKSVRYVVSGDFVKEGVPFSARDVVTVVAGLKHLKAKDRKAVKAALERYGESERARPLIDFLSGYRADPCRRRLVDENLPLESFDSFYDATVRANAVLKNACADIKAERYEAAADKLNDALEMSTMFGAGYLHRAIVRKKLEDPMGAGADYREWRKTPKGSKAASLECLCDPSLKADVRVLKKRMTKARAAKEAGVTLFGKGKLKEAVKKLDEAIHADPSDPEAYISRAVALENSGDSIRALRDYLSAADLATSLRRWDMAADSLDRSLSILGDVRADLGAATRNLRVLLENAPTDWNKRGAMEQGLDTLVADLQDAVREGLPDDYLPPGERPPGFWDEEPELETEEEIWEEAPEAHEKHGPDCGCGVGDHDGEEGYVIEEEIIEEEFEEREDRDHDRYHDDDRDDDRDNEEEREDEEG